MFPYYDRYYPYGPFGPFGPYDHHHGHHHDHHGHGGIFNNLIVTNRPRYEYERRHCWDR
jgi:hypothetical protein